MMLGRATDPALVGDKVELNWIPLGKVDLSGDNLLASVSDYYTSSSAAVKFRTEDLSTKFCVSML